MLINFQSPNEEESVLDLSIRWGQSKIVEKLLTLSWPTDYLKSGLKIATQNNNQSLIKLLKKSIAENKHKSRKKYACCFG